MEGKSLHFCIPLDSFLPFKTLIIRNGPLSIFNVLRICLKGFLLTTAVSLKSCILAPDTCPWWLTTIIFIFMFLEWRQRLNLPSCYIYTSLYLILIPFYYSPLAPIFFHSRKTSPGLEERVMRFARLQSSPVNFSIMIQVTISFLWCPHCDQDIPDSALPIRAKSFIHDTPLFSLFPQAKSLLRTRLLSPCTFLEC